MTLHLIILPQPCIICLLTELHQEFQGQAYRQTSVLPQSNYKPLPHGRTRLRLRLSSAPHGPQWTPSSHLRQQNGHAHIQPHAHKHTRDTLTNLPCQLNQLPGNLTWTQCVRKVVPHWFSPLRPVRGCIRLASLVLFSSLWMSRHKSRACYTQHTVFDLKTSSVTALVWSTLETKDLFCEELIEI